MLVHSGRLFIQIVASVIRSLLSRDVELEADEDEFLDEGRDLTANWREDFSKVGLKSLCSYVVSHHFICCACGFIKRFVILWHLVVDVPCRLPH